MKGSVVGLTLIALRVPLVGKLAWMDRTRSTAPAKRAVKTTTTAAKIRFVNVAMGRVAASLRPAPLTTIAGKARTAFAQY